MKAYPTLEEVKLEYVVFVFANTGMQMEKTAKILGIDRKTLYRWLKPLRETKQLRHRIEHMQNLDSFSFM